MMSKRRSLFIGALLPALVVLTVAAVHAGPPGDVPAGMTAATNSGYGRVLVDWMMAPSAEVGQDPATTYDVRYENVDCTTCDNGSEPTPGGVDFDFRADAKIVNTGDATTEFVVEGLKHNKRYIFAVRGRNSSGAGGWDPMEANEGVGITGSVGGLTLTAPKPDDVTGLELTASDALINAQWDETDGNGAAVTSYRVEYIESAKVSTSSSWTAIEKVTGLGAVIANLENGTEYSVRVQATNGTPGGFSKVEKATPMMMAATSTPALPIFGAFALGAGLLAAGRGRLRRRQQLLNS